MVHMRRRNLARQKRTVAASDAAAALDLERHVGDELGFVGGEPERGIDDVERQ